MVIVTNFINITNKFPSSGIDIRRKIDVICTSFYNTDVNYDITPQVVPLAQVYERVYCALYTVKNKDNKISTYCSITSNEDTKMWENVGFKRFEKIKLNNDMCYEAS